MQCMLVTALFSAGLAVAQNIQLPVRKVQGEIPKMETPIELCSTGSGPIEAAVTVEIWNDHGQSASVGSGTVVGIANGRMLTLTCHHIYGDGIGSITIRRDGQERQGTVVARNPVGDLSIILSSVIDGPVAPVHRRESRRGDRVTLAGYGGRDDRGFILRVGPAHNGHEVNVLSESGDSGGGAFVDGKLVGVLWGHEKYNNRESKIVPLREIYSLVRPVKASRGGYAIYQHQNEITLTGSITLTGLPFQGLFRGNKGKIKGRGNCGPNGCPPGFPGGQGGTGLPPGTGPDGVWYAPGFGPEDKLPGIDPNGPRVPPVPPENGGDGGSVPDTPSIIRPGPNPGQIEIDLSNFATKDEVRIQFNSVNERIDGVSSSIAGLATKPDIEIIVNSVGTLSDKLDTNLANVNERFGIVEAAITEVRKPIPPPPEKQHWVLVWDTTDSRWSVLQDAVNKARANGRVIITVGEDQIDGVVAVPQLVGWTDSRPRAVVSGQTDVLNVLRSLE